ncbi:hypothetical protein L596_005243 [Steinernema carpocapsae]|uniref:Uncharacterized protein n=1 Tax=Steinernema carpocapsae TaxID=34508 RepID=A0A4U8UYH7_STECR|nr:hypothetical protein L596_005243 [Steinernema carpocapsae]
MPEPVEELEPVEISPRLGLTLIAHLTRRIWTVLRILWSAAPLLTTTAEEEEGLATASRFEDAFVTPTVVPTDGLTDEEREHIERVMKMAQQSSFEQGVMQQKTMPEPVEELEPVEIFVNQEPQSLPDPRFEDRFFLRILWSSSSTAHNTAKEEEGLATAPRFEDAFVTPTVVPTDGLTDEEREHIERVMKMAQQSSFEQGVMQQQTMPERGRRTRACGNLCEPRASKREHIERVMKMAQQSSFEQGVMQQKTMPEPVEELEPVEIFVNQEPQEPQVASRTSL